MRNGGQNSIPGISAVLSLLKDTHQGCQSILSYRETSDRSAKPLAGMRMTALELDSLLYIIALRFSRSLQTINSLVFRSATCIFHTSFSTVKYQHVFDIHK